MGIRGLVTYLRNHNAYDEFDLVRMAKVRKDLEILVDFYGIEQHIMELTVKGLAAKYRNEYLTIPGAEYDELVSAFRDFHRLFKKIGVKLVYVTDGPKGLDKISRQNKQKSWTHRFQNNSAVHENYLAYCRNPQSPYQMIKEKIVRPYLIQDLFRKVIAEEGGEIITLVYGEADYQIATLRQQRKSWAVLTNDSDFFIFHDCPTIQIGFFDMEKDLMMGRSCKDVKDGSYCNKQPTRLMIGLVTDDIVMSQLHISSHQKLIDFAILMGNDYTADFAVALRDFLGIQWKYDSSDIADSLKVAEWVEKEKVPLLDNEKFQMFCIQRPETATFIQFCMDFYQEKIVEPVVTFSSPANEEFWNYLEKRYKAGDISSTSLTAFHGFSYQRNCVEPAGLGVNDDINSILLPLRQKIYNLFMQDGLSVVTEYEVPNVPDFCRQVNVIPTQQKLRYYVRHVPQFKGMRHNFLNRSWRFFEENWSGFCSDEENTDQRASFKYFQLFGSNIGFCCYCLHVLWRVTRRKKETETNVVISEPEFRAIFCAVFFRLLRKLRSFCAKWERKNNYFLVKYPNSWFYQLRICPSSNCQIIQEWLQVIYFHGYHLYGNSLKISRFFPEPSEFISGTVLTAFYEYAHNRGQRLRNLESDRVNAIYEMMRETFDEFGGVYSVITGSDID